MNSRHLAVLLVLAGLGPSAGAGAQEPQAPATKREIPAPEALEPGVVTSGSAAAPASASTTAPAADVPTAPAESRPAGAVQSAPAKASAAPQQRVGQRVMDRIELDTTQITGNRELPKVLYIVPWKQSDLGDLLGRPANSLLDEVLAPVDRDVFRRQNRYYDALAPDRAQRTDKAEK